MDAVLVVGAGSGGQVIANELRANPRWRMNPVAFLDDDQEKHGKTLAGVQVVGDLSAMSAVVRQLEIDTIVLAIPSLSIAAHSQLVETAHKTGCRVLTMPFIGSILRGEERVSSLKSVRPVDVLGRPVVAPDLDSCLQFIRGQRVLVTGAAGSIGHELCMQIAALEPARLIILDIDETGLHDLALEIAHDHPSTDVAIHLASVTDQERINRLFATFRPDIVLHAAAYKHVPDMEAQPDQALETNLLGTDIVARHAAAYGAQRFVLVSTDKAVRPTSVMGATKRLAELAVASVGAATGLSVCSVRFGNVLGSRGSVIPVFERQIREGGPITITDERMRRYFMTIPEAVSLIIQAGAFGHANVTYILDMGEEVAIMDLARRVVELHGLQVGRDIEFVVTGVRPGEKLHEELTLDFESAHETSHPKIRMFDGASSTVPIDLVPNRLIAVVKNLRSTPADELRRQIHAVIRDLDGHSPALERIVTDGDSVAPAPLPDLTPVDTLKSLADRAQ